MKIKGEDGDANREFGAIFVILSQLQDNYVLKKETPVWNWRFSFNSFGIHMYVKAFEAYFEGVN